MTNFRAELFERRKSAGRAPRSFRGERGAVGSRVIAGDPTPGPTGQRIDFALLAESRLAEIGIGFSLVREWPVSVVGTAFVEPPQATEIVATVADNDLLAEFRILLPRLRVFTVLPSLTL